MFPWGVELIRLWRFPLVDLIITVISFLGGIFLHLHSGHNYTF